MENRKKDKTSILTSGLVIAAVTLFGYIITFSYEYGFAKVFRIPISFIEIGLGNILVAVGAIIIIIIVLFWLADIIIIFIKSRKRYSPLRNALLFLLAPTLFVLGKVIIYGKLWKEWIFYLAGLGILFCFEFLFPFLTQRNKKTYRAKLIAQERIERSVKWELLDGFINFIFKQFKTGVVLIFVSIAIFSPLLAYDLGKREAMHQEEFLVINSEPEMIILKIYGNKLIAAPFNRESKEVMPKFSVFNLNNIEPSMNILTLEKVGPLRTQEED